MPDRPAKLPRVRPKLFALHGHVRHTNRRAEAVLSGRPRFAHSIARRLHHRVVNFLELHSRPAHSHQRDKRSEHFVCTFADLVNPCVAQHSLQRKIYKVCGTARSRQVLAAPVQHAPKVVRPKSSTVSATLRPFPSGPRIFSFGTLTSLNAKRPVAVPRIPIFGIRSSSISNPGMSGVTRKAVIAVLSDPGTGVRAITVSSCAIAALVI